MEDGDIRWVMEEIQRAIVRGISVRVECPHTMEQGETTYMEDYIGDEEGRIVEISFSRVRILNNMKYSNQI